MGFQPKAFSAMRGIAHGFDCKGGPFSQNGTLFEIARRRLPTENFGRAKKKLRDFSRSFVRVAGLEPATYWFVASCAIQLRHIRIE